MRHGSLSENLSQGAYDLCVVPDISDGSPHNVEMDGDSTGWFLKDWAERRGLRQADLVRDLGWTKNTAHRLWYGKQEYSRRQVEQVARWLDIEPYEVLMQPADAEALRFLRKTAAIIVKGPEA